MPDAQAPDVESLDGQGHWALRCSACGHPVTTRGQRLDQGGSQTFFNPFGLVFELGRFAQAPGARTEGPPCREFSWFPGHSWQVAVCRRCEAHLGWRYTGPSSFWGLILDRLVDDDA